MRIIIVVLLVIVGSFYLVLHFDKEIAEFATPGIQQEQTNEQRCKSRAMFFFTAAVARDEGHDKEEFKELVKKYVAEKGIESKDKWNIKALQIMFEITDMVYNSELEPRQIYDVVLADCMHHPKEYK